jgi:hypothetical protein
MRSAGRFDCLPPPAPAPPLIRVYQLPTAAIQYLTAHVEACEGIGLVRTLDEERGIIECWIMPDYEEDFARQLRAIAQEWPIAPLDRPFE